MTFSEASTLPERSSQPASNSATLDNDDIPAAFWDSLPNDEGNPDLMAIKALQEESTPAERAETAKAQGNELFKRGVQLNKKFFVQQAVDKYTEGIALLARHEGQVKLTLHSNRAQAHLRLGNNRHALDDALAALNISPHDPKAAFRGATAAMRLGDLNQAAEICGETLTDTAPDPQLSDLSKVIEAKRKALTAAKSKEAAERLAARAPAKRVALALTKRGWRVGVPQVSIRHRKPYLDEVGQVHWPLLFVYPEAMFNDVVEDACETDTLKDHLDVMFAPDAPPLSWDSEQAYRRDRVELYYMSNAATPLTVPQLTEALFTGWPEGFDDRGPQRYGDKATKPVLIPETARLQDVLKEPDYVIPGLPLFFVLAKGTAYRDKFLEGME